MATYEPLINALMYRAGKKLAADYPEYAKATRGTGRAASANCVVALAMARSDALGKSARENKDVQQAIALDAPSMRESFPETRSAGTGRSLRLPVPRGRLAGEVPGARRIGRDPAPDQRMLSADQPAGGLRSILAASGRRRRDAREPLDQLVKLGVPLPVSLIEKK